ncbi:RNA methyltransferase [Salimicrobium jeotgali]|uniref:RNA methyltransferase n=1 Tax=Salimicrobium jeotgali TaxID=1230341 RepID=K2FML1_9BACI|nr:RNA methyltransferase [Salimicrobium jeotgali]AKG04165.1 RNA methyltransferase [Salimicrobium jeotgali]EKE32126.1 RNA methyltransferase [Salimicrobium jeotgali]MBM7695737.1 TrmH family RNA methyltransferase [Salimicrobium jeotgali]
MITSVKNQKVKEWKKLHKKKYRDQYGLFLVEGYHLVEEVVNSDWEVKELIVQEESRVPFSYEGNKELVSEAVMKEITETETPQGIMAVVYKKEEGVETGSRFLLLDTIQDPGNLGTLIRTADAAGFDAVLIGRGSADRFNDKVVRATQGSMFHNMKVMEVSLEDEIPVLKSRGVTVWGTALQGASNYTELKRPYKVAILLGNEGNGVGEGLLGLSDERVKIPIFGEAESLNVAVAGGILMFAVNQ